MILPKDYPRESAQHIRLRDAIWARLNGWRRFLVVIDGVDAAGKSTLARYLSWQLGMSAIESDLYLVRGLGQLQYHDDGLLRVLKARLDADRPVIFEGVRARQLLHQLEVLVDFAVWVEQEGWTGSHGLSKDISTYISQFQPKDSADFVFTREAND